MRLFILIALVSFVALVAVPKIGMAGGAMHGHDCAACLDDMPADGMNRAAKAAECPFMGLCALVLFPVLNPSQAVRLSAAPCHRRPPDIRGHTISMSLDLPPPRA